MKIAPHEGWSEWMKNPSGFHNIIRELERRGFKPKEVEQMLAGRPARQVA